MTLLNDAEVAATQGKLKVLKARYESLRNQAAEDPHVRELTLRSLKRMIHQMQEELARSQAHASATNV